MIRNQSNVPQRWTSKGKKISKSLCHKEMYIIETISTGHFHFINTSEEVAVRMWPVDQPKENGKKTAGGNRKFGVIIHDEVLETQTKKSLLVDGLKQFINTKSL